MDMEKRIIILSIAVFGLCLLSAFAPRQTEQKGGKALNWISWESAIALSKAQKKKILVNIFQPSCSLCKTLENKTLNNPNIVNYLNQTFYLVKFDISHPDPIRLNDRVFKQVRKNGRSYHEFAAFLTMGSLEAPTIVFLAEDLEVLQPLPGYKSPASFEVIMTYYGDNFYQNTPWSMYKESYIPLSSKSTD